MRGHRFTGEFGNSPYYCMHCGCSQWSERSMWPCQGNQQDTKPLSRIEDKPVPNAADGIEHGVGCSCIFCRG